MTASWIYLIEAENGFVKIGRAACVRDRASSVRLHSPVSTRLIATWRGGEPEENELHRRFADLRHHGEWFEVAGDLAIFVESVRGKNVPDIPSWQEVLFAERQFFQKRRSWAARGLRKERPLSVLHGGGPA